MSKKAETIGLTRLHAIAKGIDERADGFNDGWDTDRDAERGRQTLDELENLVMTLEEERDAAKAESVANALACGKQDSAFKAAMREGWEMADPLHPLGAPGSYFRGEHNGITAALHTVQQAYDRQAAASADQTPETRNQADDFYESVVQQYNDLSRARLQTAEIGEIISTSDNVAPPSKPTDEALRTAWRTAGGEFHGPHIETGTMPEAKLLPFLRSLTAPAAVGTVAVPDGYALISTDALQAWGKLELIKAACVYPRATAPAAPAAVEPVAQDLLSHKAPWRDAIQQMATRGLTSGDDEQAYWRHELMAFDTAFGALEATAKAAPSDALDAKTIAGALFDFLGYLTTLPAQEAVTFSECHEASSAVEHLGKWAEKRSLSLDEADVLGWHTAKAEPKEVIVPCMTAEEVNALPEKARDYIHQLATNADPSGMVRENMQLRDINKELQNMYRKAADALDAKTIEAVIKNLPRYTYGYQSDEWGMNRNLCSYVAHDGPFLLRAEVLKTIATQAAQGEKS